jgi:hypothetical protein
LQFAKEYLTTLLEAPEHEIDNERNKANKKDNITKISKQTKKQQFFFNPLAVLSLGILVHGSWSPGSLHHGS